MQAFAMSDQHAATITRLFVDNVICQHGLLEELLSDRGLNFLSDFQSVCDLLGGKKVNTSGNHPQIDGFVGRFSSSL